jgi:hypothetical protein
MMKKEYSHLQSKNIKITPILAWIVDFAIATLYFDSSLMPDCIQDICKKYQASSSRQRPSLLSSLVALTLHFTKAENNSQI